MKKGSARTPSSKRGFTDRLYIYNVVFVTAVVVISFIAVFMFEDTSALTVIVPAAYAELSVHTGFVIWKAKCENQRKFKDVGGMDDGMDG